MPFELKTTACCGVNEMNNISQCKNPEEVLKSFVERYAVLGWRKVPFITFTGVVKRVGRDHVNDRQDDYGQALHNYIEGHRLGEVMRSSQQTNKQVSAVWASNDIRIWVWTPDWDALNKWSIAHGGNNAAPTIRS